MFNRNKFEVIHAKPGQVIPVEFGTKVVVFDKEGHYLTEDEYQEYQDLKESYKELKKEVDSLQGKYYMTSDDYFELKDLRKFKADCDKECEEWDKGICVVCSDKLPCKDHVWRNFGESVFREIDQETCPQENKHCSCRHIPYDQETLEDRVQDQLGEIRTELSDQWAIQRIKDMNIIRRLGEIENELEGIYCECDCCSDGEKTLPDKADKGTARKVKVRVEKSS